MLDLLAAQPLLLLFLIAAIGYPLGRLHVRGVSLGLAAVLFTGLAFGALREDLKTPPLLYEFGLVLFVYTIGVASGPSFFSGLKRGGLRENVAVLGVIGAVALAIAGLARALALHGTYAAGLLAGALTNTPALAATLERLKGSGLAEAVQAEPVVAYSVAYPMGVVGMLAAIAFLKARWRVPEAPPPEPIDHHTVLVERPEALDALPDGVRLGRHEQDGHVRIATADSVIHAGDLVSLIGPARRLEALLPSVGQDLGEALEQSRAELDMRRMFVSRADVAGQRLGDLHLDERFGAAVTRVRRGDTDLLADDRFVLQLGDRVRVVAPRERLPELARLFGDSFQKLSEVDVLTFSLGLVLGLALGLVPIPLGEGQSFRLGLAGGPLVVGLVLGALGKTGPFQWQLPYNASLTLRQLGLILFLAGVGSRSGYAFAHTVASPLGATLFASGALLTTAAALAFLWIAHRRMHVPFARATGLLAGLQTQPAVLGFAAETTKSDEPNVGYATVYPAATLAKLLLAQWLLGMGG